MAELDPLSQLLGAIDAKLQMVLKTQSEDREASAKYRTDMRRDLAEVKGSVLDLKNRVNNTADEVAELHPGLSAVTATVTGLDTRVTINTNKIAQIEPIVNDHQIKFVQGTGILNAAKVLWVILIGLGATGIGAIIHAIWPKH